MYSADTATRFANHYAKIAKKLFKTVNYLVHYI